MKFVGTALPGVLIVEPMVFADERGDFSETYNKRLFEDAVGHALQFVQENQSRSSRGVLRGLHCQLPPHEQGKLVTCCGFFEPIIPGGRLGWDGVDVAA